MNDAIVQAVVVLANNVPALSKTVQKSWDEDDRRILLWWFGFVVVGAVAVIVTLLVAVIKLYFALHRPARNLHLWDFNGKLFRNLCWDDHDGGQYSTAVVPEKHQFYQAPQPTPLHGHD